MTVSSEEHEEILLKLDQLQKDLEFHIAEAHANLMTASEIMERDDRVKDEFKRFMSETQRQLAELNGHMNELADILLGEKSWTFDGVVARSNGIIDGQKEIQRIAIENQKHIQNLRDESRQQIQELKDQEKTVKFSRSQIWTFLGTVFSTIGLIIIAIINNSP